MGWGRGGEESDEEGTEVGAEDEEEFGVLWVFC